MRFMKVLIATSLIALICAAQSEKLNLKTGTSTIEADSIERPVRFPSTIHLKGNVQIATKIVAQDTPLSLMIMVVQADEADYHEDSGEIEARGSVQVNYRDDPGGTKAGSVRIKLEKTNRLP